MVIVWILGAMVALILLISFICFHMAFYQKRQKIASGEEIPIPEGKIYEPYRQKMENWTREVRQMPYEDVQIVAYDGRLLRGKFYEYAPGAPIELMFHGYRGNAERDLPGGVQRGFQLGRSVLLADQRCCGKSQGRVITFGIREHKDCLSWIEFMLQYFGPDVKIILTGISMGASTVLMAAGKALPENVIGVLADCGYSSPKAIIKKVIGQMGLPVELSYPFVKLGARIYGGFDLEAYSPLEAMKTCKVPVIFYHGEDDDFVPCDMSRQIYDACTSRKQIVTVPGAGHGLSYAVAPKLYVQTLREFFGPEASCIREEIQ